jgi:hypothetical protein
MVIDGEVADWEQPRIVVMDPSGDGKSSIPNFTVG